MSTRSLASRLESGSSKRKSSRLARDRAADGDALALTAGERLRLAVEQAFDLQDLRRPLHRRFDCAALGAAHPQAESEVLAHRHVRIERVVLEHHRDVALARRHVVHDLAVDDDLAAGHRFEAGDHSQDRALAAARGPDQDDELAVVDLEVDAVDDLEVAVLLDQISDDHVRHRGQPFTAPAVSAPMIRRCRSRKTITAGTIDSTLAAARICVEVWL